MMKERLAPFLILLEARYAPLLFAVAPQAWAVYLWLYPEPYSMAGEFFAVMGGIGYEAIYVGAIAWAEEERWSFWTWGTAVIALLFSMAVAYYVYRYQGDWAWLHAGFPLVAFGYTMNMHAPARTVKPESDDDIPLSKTAKVKARMLSDSVSESTAWRRVKADELSMNGKEH